MLCGLFGNDQGLARNARGRTSRLADPADPAGLMGRISLGRLPDANNEVRLRCIRFP